MFFNLLQTFGCEGRAIPSHCLSISNRHSWIYYRCFDHEHSGALHLAVSIPYENSVFAYSLGVGSSWPSRTLDSSSFTRGSATPFPDLRRSVRLPSHSSMRFHNSEISLDHTFGPQCGVRHIEIRTRSASQRAACRLSCVTSSENT